MANQKDIRRAISLLLGGGLRFDQVDIVQGGEVILTSLGGDTLRLKVTEVQWQGESRPGVPAGDMFGTQPEWDMATLLRRQLPMTWNRTWLLTLLGTHHDLDAASRTSGYPAAALAEFQVRHNITNPRSEYAQLLWASGKFPTQDALARHLGIPGGTLSRYIGRPVSSRKRVDQNALVAEVVAGVLSQNPGLTAQQLNDAVFARLRDGYGEKRGRAKIVHLISRLRREPPG